MRAEKTARITGATGAQILVENAGEARAGADVAFAIRPEKIRISSAKPDNNVNALEGEVYDIAYLGDMTVYHVRLTDGQVVRAQSMNAARISDDPLTWNDRAWVSFRPDAGVVLTR